MTQKEKLYEQLLIATNERNTLTGLATIDIEAMKKGYEFSASAGLYTIAELKDKIESMKKAVEKIKTEQARDEYWATPEGAARKQELEKKEAIVMDNILFWKEKYANKAIALLKANLGDRWEVRCKDATFIEILLTDIEGNRIFGHDFELRYDDEYDIKNDIRHYFISSNIGTMGGFDPLKDADLVNLYVTFASIIGNQGLMQSLLDLMKEYDDRKNSLRDEISIIRKQLDNPFAE